MEDCQILLVPSQEWIASQIELTRNDKQKRVERKRESVWAFVQQLSKEIGPASRKGGALQVIFHDEIPARHDGFFIGRWSRRVPPRTEFQHAAVHAVLIRHANAPSKVTKTIIREIALQLREIFTR